MNVKVGKIGKGGGRAVLQAATPVHDSWIPAFAGMTEVMQVVPNAVRNLKFMPVGLRPLDGPADCGTAS